MAETGSGNKPSENGFRRPALMADEAAFWSMFNSAEVPMWLLDDDRRYIDRGQRPHGEHDGNLQGKAHHDAPGGSRSGRAEGGGCA